MEMGAFTRTRRQFCFARLAPGGFGLTLEAVEVVVTGGTGFVGREVVRQLLAAGHRLRLVVRSPEPQPGDSGRPLPGAGSANLERFPVSLGDSGALASVFQGAGAVVHLIGIISECGERTFAQAHVGTTRAVLEAARIAAVSRYLHMSALGTREGARSRYHQTKWAAECLVRESDLAWTIFRPSLIYGAEDGFTRLFARLSRMSPMLPLIGGGHGLVQPIAVEQVARAIVTSLANPVSHRRVYTLCGRERLTFRQVIAGILATVGRGRFLVNVPFPLARGQARILELVWPRVLRRAPPLNRDQILMLQEDNVGDGSEADAAFDLVHEPFAEGLRRCLTRLRD